MYCLLYSVGPYPSVQYLLHARVNYGCDLSEESQPHACILFPIAAKPSFLVASAGTDI